MSITPSEWALLRAVAWHRVMLVARGSRRAREAALLKGRRLISTERVGDDKALIRITDAGMMEAAKTEEELNHDSQK